MLTFTFIALNLVCLSVISDSLEKGIERRDVSASHFLESPSRMSVDRR